MADSTVKVTFLGDARDLNKAIGSADKDLQSFSQKVAAHGKQIALGMAAAGVGIAVLAKSAIDAASDQNEALSKSNTVFRESATEIQAWAKTTAKSIGLSKTEALAAAGGFGNLFTQLGIAPALTAKMSKEMVGLAADFASFHNADISEVLEAQSAAFRGEYDSLQKFVPLINAATVEQKALALTGKKTTAELTAQDKALAVNALMFEGAGDAMGDFARTSDGAANQQRIMKARLADLQAEIGQKLLPIYQKLLGFILDTVIPGIQKLGQWMQDHKGIVIAVGAVIATILVAAFIAWAVAAASAAAATLAAISPILAIIAAIALLAAGIIYAYTHWGWFKTAVDAVAEAGRWLWEHVLKPFAEWIVRDFVPAVAGIATKAIEVAKEIKEKFTDIVTFITELPGKIKSAAAGMWDGIKEAFRDTLNWIIRGWNSLDFEIPGFDPPGPGPKFGGFTLGVPDIPELHSGGVFRTRTPGGEGLALLQDGERVLARGQQGGVTVIVQGSVLSERDLVGVLNNALRRGLVVGG